MTAQFLYPNPLLQNGTAYELRTFAAALSLQLYYSRSCTETRILQTDAYLMSLTVLSANVAQFRLLTVQILFQVHSFKTERSMNFKLLQLHHLYASL